MTSFYSISEKDGGLQIVSYFYFPIREKKGNNFYNWTKFILLPN